MKILFSASAIGAVLALVAGAASASVIYKLDVTTSYQFGAPAGASGYVGSPDTGFVTITNSGPTTFTGSLGDTAVSGCCGDFSQSFAGVTLATGQSFTFGVSPESSNDGGFGPNGINVLINGTVGSTAVSLSVLDSQIHSGTVNGGGLTDAYVLQGGCPSGCDYGDAIEVSQAPGMYTFQLSGGVPEPATWTMMLVGVCSIGAGLRMRRASRFASAA